MVRLRRQLPVEQAFQRAAFDLAVGLPQRAHRHGALLEIDRLVFPDDQLLARSRRQHREAGGVPRLDRRVLPVDVAELGEQDGPCAPAVVERELPDRSQDRCPARFEHRVQTLRRGARLPELAQRKVGVDRDVVQGVPEGDHPVLVEVRRVGKRTGVDATNLGDQLPPVALDARPTGVDLLEMAVDVEETDRPRPGRVRCGPLVEMTL